MPLIEVLPNSTAATAPGWAYVPDTGFDPSKAAIQPTGSRHRAARNVAADGGHDRSVRQNNAILKHLAELDKDNHRDVQIPVPVRQRDGAGRASRGKVTPAVRKILTSQKTFANYLADEEALLSIQGPSTAAPAPIPRTSVAAAGKATKLSRARGKRASLLSVRATSTPTTAAGPEAPDAISAPNPEQPPSKDDADPLLKSLVPDPPTSSQLEELVSAPPLSYAAARAKAPSSALPGRHFCEICGYWGRAKCLKCGARVCGLECKGVHDEGRCLKFYA
ncbi:MAG: hypothetical protein M1832_002396 [Thelocarpon impressellum]|nr:MAG: hypothetical protein M1832_002396 [Thelocarpon impressellum]